MSLKLMGKLSSQAREMLGYLGTMRSGLDTILTSINTTKAAFSGLDTNFSTVDENLKAITVFLQAGDSENALLKITESQTVITASRNAIWAIDLTSVQTIIEAGKTAVSSATDLINSLIPLITDEVKKVYDPDNITEIKYKCKECMMNCPDVFYAEPLDPEVLKICKLSGKKEADFKQVGGDGHS